MKNVVAISGWICAVVLALLIGSTRTPPAHAANGAGIRYVNPPGLATPIARYSHAVAVPAGEDLIFVSGEGGDTSKGEPVSDDIVAQTRQTMENLKTALEACGSDFAHVVKMNIYLTDISHMPELRKVRDAYLDPKRAPAMTTAKVSQLIGTNTKVEIEVVAVRSR
jgi:enamine deaminase RidA (YjgF/YER057c/UK114 family)